MNKVTLLATITTLLGLQASPILSHAQTVTESVAYHPFYLEGVYYDSTTGILSTESDFDATDKTLIKNESIQLSTLSYHSIHFWDNNGDYLGHYVTPGAKECVNACIGTVSTSDIPLPLGAYSYAIERFDRDDADYDIATNVSLTELFGATTYNLVGDSDFDYTLPFLNNIELTSFYTNNNLLIDNYINNGNFSNSYTGWTRLNTNTVTYTVTNEILVTSKLAGIYTDAGIYQTVTLNNQLNDKILFYLTYKGPAGPILWAANSGGLTGLTSLLTMTNTPDYTIKSTVWTSTKINFTWAFFYYTDVTTYYIDNIRVINLSQMVRDGIIGTADKTTYETWATTYSDYGVNNYFDTIYANNTNYSTYESYYNVWLNQTVSGLETIDQQYYLNGDRKEIYDLTTIFGSGSEPNLATMQGYYTDYDALFDYSTISSLAWAVAPTYTVTYWDDQVGATLTNVFGIVVSAVIGFVLMFMGMTKRAALLNIMAVAAFVFFTIQFTALPMIILGVMLVVVNLLFVYNGLVGGN